MLRSLRPLRAGLAPVLLMASLAAFVSGCSSDAEPDADGPTVTATGPEETSETPTDTATDDASSTPPDQQDAVATVCAPYTAMVTAIKDAASKSNDPDEIAAEIGPVLKEFAAQVPGLERPPGLSAATWQGVVALATQIGKLPDQPTDADIEAVEGQLSQQEQEAVEDAFSWFQTNCA